MSKTDAGFNGVGVAGNNLPSGPTGGRANLSEKLGRGGGVNGIDGPKGKGLTIPPRSINVGP